mmetsp:Transcript_28264/g.40240  ORF Transcript_28264/g.40240 Transcript_28264/m.40240 type:complete len:279 (-) Transcript_28264:942-1778(-)
MREGSKFRMLLGTPAMRPTLEGVLGRRPTGQLAAPIVLVALDSSDGDSGWPRSSLSSTEGTDSETAIELLSTTTPPASEAAAAAALSFRFCVKDADPSKSPSSSSSAINFAAASTAAFLRCTLTAFLSSGESNSIASLSRAALVFRTGTNRSSSEEELVVLGSLSWSESFFRRFNSEGSSHVKPNAFNFSLRSGELATKVPCDRIAFTLAPNFNPHVDLVKRGSLGTTYDCGTIRLPKWDLYSCNAMKMTSNRFLENLEVLSSSHKKPKSLSCRTRSV